jgi:hypothetical protein
LAGYPGWAQLPPQGPYPWPSSAGPAGPLVAWCEVARQTDVLGADLTGWPGVPTGAPDGSFADTASGFDVKRVRIVALGQAGDHEYTFRDPSGTVVATLQPKTGVPASFEATVNVPAGMGIWAIEIRRLPTSSTGSPGLYVGGPAKEPYIGMYGSNVEGLLQVEFDGDEIVTTCPKSVSLVAELESVAGNNTWAPIPAGACVPVGRQVRLTATPAPANAAPGLEYEFDFDDGTPTSSGPADQVIHTYATAGTLSPSVIAWRPNSSCAPKLGKATVSLDCCGSTGQYWDDTQKNCTDCPGRLVLTLPTPGCAPGKVGSLTFTATAPAGPTPTSYTWSIDGPKTPPAGAGQIHVTRPTTSATADLASGWSGTGATAGGAVVLPYPGEYTVSVSAKLPGSAAKCVLQTSDSLTVPPCPCPAGQHWDVAQGRCVDDPPITCPQGQHWDAAQGKCVDDPPITCAKGQHWDAALGRCVDDVPPCPKDQHFDAAQGRCVPDVPSMPSCAILLVLSIALLLVGAVLVVVGVCTAVPWVWIAGAIVGGLGLLLFVIWALVCARFTACPLMRTMHCILFWIIAVVAPVLVVVAAIFGGLPCALAAAAAWGGWGTLYAWLGAIMRGVGCTPTC